MSMNETADKNPPAWALPAGLLFSIAVVALIGVALAQAERWTETQTVRFAAVFFAVFGVGFLLSSYSPQGPLVFRYLVRVARRGRRWFRLSGLITGGEPKAAGWLCLALAAAVALLSFLLPRP